MKMLKENNHFNVMKSKSGTFVGTTKKVLALAGWKSLTLITVGSICGALNGGMLVLRVLLISNMFDDYVGWSKYETTKSLNISESTSFGARLSSYFGESLKTESQFIDSMNRFCEKYYILGAVAFVLSFVQLASWEMVNNANVEKLRERFFRQAVRLDVTWHDLQSKDNDLNTRLSNDLESVRNNLGAKMSLMIYSLACLVGSIAIGFRLHWKLGLINFIGIVLIGTSTVVYGRLLSRASVGEQKNCRVIGNVATEILTSLKVVKSFGRECAEMERFAQVVNAGKTLSSRKYFIFSIYSAINSCFPYAIVSAVTCCAAVLMSKREISPGHYIGMITCVLAGAPAFNTLLPVWSDIAEALTSFSHLTYLTEIEPRVDPLSDLGVSVFDTVGDICFKNVSYAYPSRKEVQVLKGLSLKIPKHRTVALVGPNGSGKSTIINLILRLFDPDSGKVTIGFTDVRIMNLNLLRKKIGVVTQDVALFDTTVEENIRCGNLEATFDDVMNAAELANAHAFITDLPNGYKTLVGELGFSLSGGQKQRIAIARALIRDPDILLLDEATSSLDSNNEKIVRKTLESAMKGRTTVIVTHKLSTVKKADLIYVIQDGRVVETGGYTDLIFKRGYFYTMIAQGKLLEKRKKSHCFTVLPTEFLKEPKAISKKSLQSPTVTSNITSNAPTEKGTLKFLYQLSPRWISLSALILSILSGLHCTVYVLFFNNVILAYFKMPYRMSSKFLFGNGINLIYLAMAVALVNVLMNLAAFISTDKIIKELRIRMFHSLINQKMMFFDNPNCSPIHAANTIIQKPGELMDIAGSKGANMLCGFTLVMAAIISSFLLFWQMTLVQVAFLVPVFIVSYFQIVFKLRKQIATNILLNTASKWASECFDNMKTIHCLGLQTYAIDVYQRLCSPLKTGMDRDVLVYAASYAASCSINYYYFFAVGVNIASSLVVNGVGSMDYVFTSSYNFILSFAMIPGLVMYYQDFSRSKSAIVEAVTNADLLEAEPRLIKAISPIKLCKIEFIDVCFKYPNEENRYALNGFNLTINSGETVGLVGASGHGKSTVVNLIEKFFSPTQGKILIDGVNINDIDEEYLRNQIGLVLQEPQLFNTTIRENILYGLDSTMNEASDEQIVECCKQADVYDFIMKLPERFETIVGARGSQLSEGQKQKVAIARALIRKPKILVLDEATSALDVESEKEVLSGLLHARQGQTTIIVAHRLSTVRNADVIAVVENGAVTEKGSHEELIEMKGRYYSLLR